MSQIQVPDTIYKNHMAYETSLDKIKEKARMDKIMKIYHKKYGNAIKFNAVYKSTQFMKPDSKLDIIQQVEREVTAENEQYERSKKNAGLKRDDSLFEGYEQDDYQDEQQSS